MTFRSTDKLWEFPFRIVVKASTPRMRKAFRIAYIIHFDLYAQTSLSFVLLLLVTHTNFMFICILTVMYAIFLSSDDISMQLSRRLYSYVDILVFLYSGYIYALLYQHIRPYSSYECEY